MELILDDWLVIIKAHGIRRIYVTEMWPEWGNVGTTDTTDDEKLYAERKVIESALLRFYADLERKS